MALDRTNMVSLMDIGSLMGGKTSKIVEMGDGFNEITEDWGPQYGIDTVCKYEKCEQYRERICTVHVPGASPSV